MVVENWPSLGVAESVTKAELAAAQKAAEAKAAEDAATAQANAEAKIAEAEIWIDVRKHGAKGDGVTDDTAAINAAIAALGGEPGGIFFPRQTNGKAATYVVAGALTALDDTRSIILRGVAGLTSGAAPASRILYTGEGAGNLLSCKSTTGLVLVDLAICYNKAGFTGTLVNLSHSAKGGDSAHFYALRCQFAGQGVATALGVDLDKAILCGFEDCEFSGLKIAARGAAAAGSHSNVITFHRCDFTAIETVPLQNPCDSWEIANCSFDTPLTVATTAAAVASQAGIYARAFRFISNWCGDVSEQKGTWLDLLVKGCEVRGNLFGNAAIGLKVSGESAGVECKANFFEGSKEAMVLEIASNLGYEVGANYFVAVEKELVVSGRSLPRAASLGGGEGARVYNNAAQEIKSSLAENSIVAYNAERYDSNGLHDNAVNNSRITVQRQGVFMIGASVRWAANEAGIRNIKLIVNGGTIIAEDSIKANSTDSNVAFMNINTIASLNAGDYVEVAVQQNTGGFLKLESLAAYSPEFWLSRMPDC